jgi:SAM-dependent methyltransferase
MMTGGAMRSWIEFWDSNHAIYVNNRHKHLHAQHVGRDITRHIRSPNAIVLDHGCGEALYAANIAARCGRLLLCEAAPSVRTKLAARVAGNPKIEVVDPAGVAALPDEALDLVIANSLVQYLRRDELAVLLDAWRRKLKPGGELIVADVIPPEVSRLTDALALLRFACSGGFLGAAIFGLARTAFSDYAKIRAKLGFSMYREEEFLSLLRAHGYEAARIQPNFGHNQTRMTFRGTRA